MPRFIFLLFFLFCTDQRKERTMLNSVLSEDALILPCKGILKACAMSLPVSFAHVTSVLFPPNKIK